MNAIIRKRPIGALAAYGGYLTPYKRARVAYNVGRVVYQNRGRFYRAARTIGRYYRRYRRRRRAPAAARRIGNRVGHSTAKTELTLNDTAPVVHATRTFYAEELCAVDKTTVDAINHRQRGIANIRGVKLCWAIQNRLSFPLYFNIAVVTRKNDGTPATTDFFRQHNQNRHTDFVNARTALEFHCLPINTDDYRVLTHKRFILAPANATANTAFTMPNTKSILQWDKYIPIKRQFTYDDTANTPTNERPFVVYWMDQWNDPTAQTPRGAACDIMRKHLLYFKEPKN